MDKQVLYLVYRMIDSLLLWIGLESDPSFHELSVAMMTRYEKDPMSTKLLGAPTSTTSSSLAARLSKKCNKQVFVSCNFPETDSSFLTSVEERLVEEMKMSPEAF